MAKDERATITEGTVRILKDENTFFNPAQKLNRDLSVEVIRTCFADKSVIRILDAMSATGLRGIRYFKEIANSVVYLNDVSESAFNIIRNNVLLNGIREDDIRCFGADLRGIRVEDGRQVTVVKSDCNVLMTSLPCFFDVIDIDPFGSCSEYINNAVKAVRHGGLLCFTATDKAVLCSNEKKCQIKYSTTILRRIGMNELPLRTIISLISREASKYGASVEPLVSLSVDFYVRIFVRILKRNPKSVLTNNSHVFLCTCYNMVEIKGCHVNNRCANCDGSMKLCGPFWNSSLHDTSVVKGILDTLPQTADKRLFGILRYLKQEIHTMFYYEIPKLCSILKINTIKQIDLMNALANLGYSVSYTHSELNGIKTDAPIELVNKILFLHHKQDEDGLKEAGITFEENEVVRILESTQFFKGLLKSGMGPLSVPRKK